MISNSTSNPARVIRVLVVDDDKDDFYLLREMLREIPNRVYTVDWEPEFQAALEMICKNEHDVYFIDYHLGAQTGVELLKALRQRKCSGPTILLTGQGELEIDRAAQAAGADEYLEKNRLDSVVLERIIRYAIRQHAQEAELECKVAKRTEELEAANQALRDADRRKDEFLATLAHEIRNPLTPITNALKIQKLLADDHKAVENARQIIERQVSQLVRLLDDLLDASRFTRGKLQVHRERLDLRIPIEIALEATRPAFEKAGVNLKTRIPDQTLPVHGDQVRLVQLFTNILNNATKYTTRGGNVMLIIAKEDAHYCVSISDTGAGIPTDKLDQVFQLFSQIDRTLNRSSNGLGIGLAIAHSIVELHDGKISVQSPGLNLGSTFTIRLPIDD